LVLILVIKMVYKGQVLNELNGNLIDKNDANLADV
jgi:hypothetical protein